MQRQGMDLIKLFQDQSAAIQQIMHTGGMKAILSKCKEVHETNCKPLSARDNWAIERAIRDGKAAASKEIMEWIASRAISRDSTPPTEA